MSNLNVVSAVRATILLGDIQLDVFQMPCGEYKYSKTDIEASLGYEPTRRAYRNFLKSKDSKAVQAKELSGGNTSLKYMSKTYTLVTQEEVSLFWAFQAQNGNQLAFALVLACMQETLERRANEAFGLKQSIEQANALFKQRVDSKIFRRSFTDAIKEYPYLTGERPNYGRITIYLYQKLGIYKDYLLWKSVEDETKLAFRDGICPTLLKRILEIEDLAAKLILNRKLEPCAALRQAGEILTYIEPK